MKRAHVMHRKLPAALRFCLILLALAALAYPFRMPPTSRAKSNDFYKTDGSNTAQQLKDADETLNYDIVGANGTLHVNASVEVPDIQQIPILRASQGGIDIEALQTALGLDADTAEVAEDSIESYAYLRYDIKYRLIWYDNGTLDINDTGKIKAYIYDPGKAYSADEIVDMLHSGGLISDDVEVTYINGGSSLLIRPIYEQLPVSNTFSFDSFTGVPNNGVSLVVEQRAGGTMLSIEGRTLGQAQVIWDNVSIVSPEEALKALAEYCKYDETVQRIALTYHTRSIYGDPFNVILYPVWEIYAQSSGSLNASIVNAITGKVELSMLKADA